MKYTIEKTEEFDEWLKELTAKQEALVYARIQQIRDDGHFGWLRHLGEGLIELKWKNGLRVYFLKKEQNKIIFLLGGMKNAQKKDIQKARRMY